MFASAIDTDACSVECLHPDQIRPLLGHTLSREGASAIVSLFEALADPSRARIIHLLAIAEAELSVCDIALVLGTSVSALSHQPRWLRERAQSLVPTQAASSATGLRICGFVAS